MIMTKFILLCLTSLLLISVYAQTSSVYDAIAAIKQNPSLYTIIIGKIATLDEINAASSLVEFFGVTRTNFDEDIHTGNNLIIVGLAKNNNMVQRAVTRGSIIYQNGSNLIISGATISDLNTAIEMVLHYEINREKLQNSELYMSNLFSLNRNFIFSFGAYLLGIVIVAGLVGSLVVHKKKQLRKAVIRRPQFNPAYNQLQSYIITNLRKGYTEEQVKTALFKGGWQPELIERAFYQVKQTPR